MRTGVGREAATRATAPDSAAHLSAREIEREQRAVDTAHDQLARMRARAIDVVRHHQGLSQLRTSQARIEWESLMALTEQRLRQLDIGDTALCFGRLDPCSGDGFLVGRVGVFDADGDPLVVDWRAEAAEPFYRATGRRPMGLARRRHLLMKGRVVAGIEDELFDESGAAATMPVVGEGALLASLSRSRTARMADIVATIQAEQDEIIRAPLPGVLIVSGGPGTGKTAVALHRAAYQLFTHRERLEEAGVLVVGPNRRFLRYIEHVLPSLGESGVHTETTTSMTRFGPTRIESAAVARIKGDARMVEVLERAVRQRERPLRDDLVVPFGSRYLRVPQTRLRQLARAGRRRQGTHNARRRWFVRAVTEELWSSQLSAVTARLDRLDLDTSDDVGPDDLGTDDVSTTESTEAMRTATIARESERFWESIDRVGELRAAFERMWPLLSAEELLHDLFGAPSLLARAVGPVFGHEAAELLHRPRSARVGDVEWTDADVALLDEAERLVGPTNRGRRRGKVIDDDTRWLIEDVVDDVTLQTGDLDPTMRRELIRRLAHAEAASRLGSDVIDDRVFGHVIVDEAQDVTAMEWRMIARRCPSGSMTIVGDLGQASRPGAAASWDDVVVHLPGDRPTRVVSLHVNYRTPSEIMDVAARVLADAAPEVAPPRSVRTSGFRPERSSSVERALAQIREGLDDPRIAVIGPVARLAELRSTVLDDTIGSSEADDDGPLAVLGAIEAKGLEFDGVVVVDPAAMVSESDHGLRSLYVALTRATQRLVVVGETLPVSLAGQLAPT